jgi:hypothetical protein
VDFQLTEEQPLNPKGQIYCRDIREVPGNPRKLWVAAGGGFQSEVGVLRIAVGRRRRRPRSGMP